MIAIGIGAIIGFGTDVGKQLIDNGGNFSEINWGSAINNAIVGGAVGLSYALGVSVLGPVIAGSATASWSASMVAFGISSAVSFGAGALGYSVQELINGKTPNFGKAMVQGGLTALKGMINYTFGGFVGSYGRVGERGKIFTWEWWKKLGLRKAYTLPFEYVFDYLQLD